MKEIEANKKAWGSLAKVHYEHCLKTFKENKIIFTKIIEEEIGEINGKRVIHLQCNTGADTILLAKKGAIVTGVDLVPENIFYARKLSEELGIQNIDFIESDIMTFMSKHHEKYDMVFTTEGVLTWLPDLNKWAETINHLLKDNGILYVMDNHPFSMMFNGEKLKDNILEIRYPYFKREPDFSEEMDDYWSDNKTTPVFEWMYKISDIINPLAKNGFMIEFFNEFDTLYFDMGDMKEKEYGIFHYPHFEGKMPFSFSLKARKVLS